MAIDFSNYFTAKTKRRKISTLVGLFKYLSNPELISIGGGMPTPDLFPFSSFSTQVVKPGSSFENSGVELLDVAMGRSVKQNSSLEPLSVFMQYGPGSGFSSLIKFFYNHMEHIHKPKYEDWSVILSVGSTDGLNKVTELFLEDGDPILVDEWSYPTAIETFASLGYPMVLVKMDTEGMIPESLDDVCSNWAGSRPLRMVYLIPTGQNPTGFTMSLERRREIYKVCQKHDILIIEDDPYYYLQFNDAPVVTVEDETEEYFNKYLPGIDSLIPSFLSIDVDGRVLRLDTLSKLLAPNMRLGWITAQANLIEKIKYHNETTIGQPCGISQGLTSTLLNEVWGPEGFIKQVLYLQKGYLSRRNTIMSSIYQNLGNMVEVAAPVGGMFVWLKINLPNHLASKPGIMAEVFEAMIENHVMLVPGWQFSPVSDPTPAKDKPYFRAAFSFAAKADLTHAIERLATVLEQFGCQK